MVIKFMLLVGPSGAGKSTIIRRLRQLDRRFVYISPYITRNLRPKEKDKIHISTAKLEKLKKAGEILAINRTYSTLHGTPKSPILKALSDHNFPVLDWPVKRVWVMKKAFGNRLFVIYVRTAEL